MPRTKRRAIRPKRTRRTKRGYKRRRGNATQLIAKGPLISDRFFTKLKYVDRLYFTSTSGAVTSNYYRGNSLYDPYGPTGGHQPLGYDQYAQFYNKYRVYASKVKIQILNQGTTAAAQNFFLSIVPQVSSVPMSNMDTIMESAFAKSRQMNISRPITMSNFMKTAKILGLNRKVTEMENDLAAAVSTDPAMPWYWQIYAQTSDAATTGTVYVRITITYYAEFFDRVQLATS